MIAQLPGRLAARKMSARAGISVVAAIWLAAILIAAGAQPQAAAAPQRAVAPAAAPARAAQATLQRYCLTCHNQNLKERGTVPIAFDTLKVSNIGAETAAGEKEVWEKIVRKVRTGLMPPSGRPRPDKAGHDAFVSELESALDSAAAAHPNPGRTEPFHRLNRAEYKNVIRDLLDLDVNVDSMLPADDASYGFDNIAGVLKMSPTAVGLGLLSFAGGSQRGSWSGSICQVRHPPRAPQVRMAGQPRGHRCR